MKLNFFKLFLAAATFMPFGAYASWLYPDQLQGQMCAQWVCQDADSFPNKTGVCSVPFSGKPDPSKYLVYTGTTRNGQHCWCHCDAGAPDFGGNIQ